MYLGTIGAFSVVLFLHATASSVVPPAAVVSTNPGEAWSSSRYIVHGQENDLSICEEQNENDRFTYLFVYHYRLTYLGTVSLLMTGLWGCEEGLFYGRTATGC